MYELVSGELVIKRGSSSRVPTPAEVLAVLSKLERSTRDSLYGWTEIAYERMGLGQFNDCVTTFVKNLDSITLLQLSRAQHQKLKAKTQPSSDDSDDSTDKWYGHFDGRCWVLKHIQEAIYLELVRRKVDLKVLGKSIVDFLEINKELDSIYCPSLNRALRKHPETRVLLKPYRKRRSVQPMSIGYSCRVDVEVWFLIATILMVSYGVWIEWH